jgi:hypothetical protein
MNFIVLEKNDFENFPYTISFNLPPSKKASQSITRSKKLCHRKK